jgi:division protein CdvB (Snf7/Vps24/ESCRT-III family)
MKFNTTLLTIGALAFSLTSCSVYYTTSEVNSSLKTTVDQVIGTVTDLDIKILNAELEYNAIECDQKSKLMIQADEMMGNIDLQRTKLDDKSKEVVDIYYEFAQYTKGKEKIQSGTPEWDKLKQTKEHMKSLLDEIQSEGNSIVEKANELNGFITKNIVPTIQLCDVAVYTSQFEKAISDLTLNQKQVGTELTQYQKQVTELISKYSASKPSLCKELSADLQKINTDVTQISRIKMNLQMAVNAFKTNTQGKTKIYSCSSDWKIVTEAENAVNAQQKEANALQQSIQTTATHLQTLIIALGQ